jgi:hypothetical protein
VQAKAAIAVAPANEHGLSGLKPPACSVLASMEAQPGWQGDTNKSWDQLPAKMQSTGCARPVGIAPFSHATKISAQ